MSDNEEPVDSYPPWNFSWVVPNKLAAMAWPRNKENLRYIYEEGIRHLITLSPEKLPPVEEFPELEWTQIPIMEFEAPTVKDILKFIDVCQRCEIKNQPVGVHSRMGKDRTGVMVACYLMRVHELDPERALNELREMRPRSIEDLPDFESVINEFHESFNK